MIKNRACGVYKIENTITGDFYIGSSKHIYQRFASHKCQSSWDKQPNSPMYKDMQKYGVESFEFIILCEVEPEQLTVMEQKMIEELRPTYNNYNAKGRNVERYKNTDKLYKESHREERRQQQLHYDRSDKGKSKKREYRKSDKYKCYDKKIKSRKCFYEGKILTFISLYQRLKREGVQNSYQEAKRYIIQDV